MDFKQALSKRSKKIFVSLASQGEQFTRDLHGYNNSFLNKYIAKGYSLMSILSAIDIIWSGYAKDGEDFMEGFLEWVNNKIPFSSRFAQEQCLYKGEDSLYNTMHAMKIIIEKFERIAPPFDSCDAKDLVKFQQRALREAILLLNRNKIREFGSWMFLGLFKIIVSSYDRFWSASNIDALVMPSGISVTKGIRRLIQEYPETTNFDPSWLSDSEPGLVSSYGKELLIHDECKRIGDAAGYPAMHVNSGLYIYGRKEIDL